MMSLRGRKVASGAFSVGRGRSTRCALYGAMALTMVALAACGSSAPASTQASSSASAISSTTAAVPASAAKPTGAPIVIGNVGTYSGPIGSADSAVPGLLQRWATSVNAAGGINGHPVKVVSQDDGASQANALTDVTNMVAADHVVAFVGNQTSVTVQAYAPFLTQHRIPAIGGEIAENVWFSSPMFFPQGPANDPVIAYGVAKTAVANGIKKIAALSANFAVVIPQMDAVDREAAALGVQVVNKQTVTVSQTNYSAQCLAAQGAGAQGIVADIDPGTYVQLIESCNKIGYHPLYIQFTSQQSSVLTSVPGGFRGAGVQGWFPWFATAGTPAVQDYTRQVLGTIPASNATTSVAGTWAGLAMFVEAAKRGVPRGGAPTSADILKGLWGFRNTTVGGLTTPLTFTQGKPAPAGRCWFETAIANGKFTLPTGLTPQCMPAGAS